MAIWIDPAPSAAAPATLRTLLSRLLEAGERARQRQRLAQLDEDMLRDIGLTREQALLEARRRAWGAPRHWLS